MDTVTMTKSTWPWLFRELEQGRPSCKHMIRSHLLIHHGVARRLSSR